MRELRPNCECCDRDLAVDDSNVYICTFECTWCADCVAMFPEGLCPTCGGNLTSRPVRPPSLRTRYPASDRRVVKAGCREIARSRA